MKRFSEQLHTKSQSIKLSSAEKAQLQERLVSYMEYHPLPTHLKTTMKKSSVTTDSFATVRIPFAFFFKSSAVVAAFVLLVVPFMAEHSVPGDSLYAVKVQFNEEVRSTLTFDTVQKVEWETERVNRRIAEARLLASEGRLTEEVEAEVAHAVLTHTQNAQREIALLRETDVDGATIASIAFDSTLEAQATSLKEKPPEDGELAMVLLVPANKTQNLIANAVDESRALNEKPNASSSPSYEKLMARVEIGTTRMYELRDSIADTDSETYASITRRIEDIERSITSAIEHSSDAKSDSQQTLISVLQRSQKLIVFMTDLEVSQTVDIDELVPVVLTGEEEKAGINVFNSELNSKLELIQTTLENATSTKKEVREKVEKGLSDISKLQEKMQKTVKFIDYKALATEAIEIATDSLKVLETNAGRNTLNPLLEIPVVTPSTTASTSVENSATTTAPTSTTSIDT